jgi:hypothetical protein
MNDWNFTESTPGTGIIERSLKTTRAPSTNSIRDLSVLSVNINFNLVQTVSIENYFIEPPAFSILARAEAETLHIETFTLTSISPLPKILTLGKSPPTLRTSPFSNRVLGSTYEERFSDVEKLSNATLEYLLKK